MRDITVTFTITNENEQRLKKIKGDIKNETSSKHI